MNREVSDLRDTQRIICAVQSPTYRQETTAHRQRFFCVPLTSRKSSILFLIMGVDPWVDRWTFSSTFWSGGDTLCFVPLLFRR